MLLSTTGTEEQETFYFLMDVNETSEHLAMDSYQSEISAFEYVSISLHCLEAWLGAFMNVLTIISIVKFDKL